MVAGIKTLTQLTQRRQKSLAVKVIGIFIILHQIGTVWTAKIAFGRNDYLKVIQPQMAGQQIFDADVIISEITADTAVIVVKNAIVPHFPKQ